MSGADAPRVRNASPFYKDQQAQRFGLHGAKRVTTAKERREEAILRKKSTSEILDDQYKTYRDEQRMQDSRVNNSTWDATKIQTEQDVERLSGVPTKHMNKQKAYLRSIRFSGIMNRFLTIKSSGSAQRKVRLAYYLVPMFVFTGISLSHFINTSFGVYLKYQALIDTYHKQ